MGVHEEVCVHPAVLSAVDMAVGMEMHGAEHHATLEGWKAERALGGLPFRVAPLLSNTMYK